MVLFASCNDNEFGRPASPGIHARIATIRGNNLDSMTRDVLDAIGGIKIVVNEGEMVFIKPNIHRKAYTYEDYYVAFGRTYPYRLFDVNTSGEVTEPGTLLIEMNNVPKKTESEKVLFMK